MIFNSITLYKTAALLVCKIRIKTCSDEWYTKFRNNREYSCSCRSSVGVGNSVVTRLQLYKHVYIFFFVYTKSGVGLKDIRQTFFFLEAIAINCMTYDNVTFVVLDFGRVK